MKNNVQHFIEAIKNKLFLFGVQLILSFFALGICSWNTVSSVKELLLTDHSFEIFPWVFIFFHPAESNLINYVFLCIILGLYSLFVYLILNKKNTELIQNLEQERNSYSYLILFGSAISLILIPFLSVAQRIIISFVVFLTPLFYLLVPVLPKKTLSILAWIMLFLISLEPFFVINGPVYLMNEYQDIYGITRIKGEDVNSRDFLTYLNDNKIDDVLKAFDVLKSEIGISGNIFNELKNININPLQQFVIFMTEGNELSWKESLKKLRENSDVSYGDENYKDFFEKLKTLDLEKVKKFYLYNELEYSHQNMARGQINHIGHILNPINEYAIGKPLKDIYMQYGLGCTFIFKWTMELFGEASIQDFYKCYAYYIVYFIIFLAMLYLIFKDWLYVLGGFSFLCLSFFFQGYIAFILAPGIIPVIHFFDASAIILMFMFYRQGRLAYLWGAMLLAILGIIINRQFGSMLMVSLLISTLLYIIENKEGNNRSLWLLNLAAVSILSLLVFYLSMGGTSDDTFHYFLIGLFSWPAKPIIIFFTILYLVASYLLMFYLKEEKFYFKYIYLFVFVYTQCLFVYYYWSGLTNHLPTVLPFAGLQLMLMLFISKTILFKDKEVLKKGVNFIANLMPFVLILLISISVFNFYKEKRKVYKIFTNHKTYKWDMARANLITTIDTDLIREGINLIHKFDEGKKGIYIISKYDNLIPFLAERYSLMPYFEMNWHLFTDREVNDAIDRIRTGQPQYIFVDTNFDQETITDPWSKIYTNYQDKKERTSRIGRYNELKKIFTDIKADYAHVETGKLLTVYKKKA